MPPGKPHGNQTRDLRRAWTDKRAGKWISAALTSVLCYRPAPIIFPVCSASLNAFLHCRFGQPLTIRARILGLPRKMSVFIRIFSPLAPPIAMRRDYGIFSHCGGMHKWQGEAAADPRILDRMGDFMRHKIALGLLAAAAPRAAPVSPQAEKSQSPR